MAAQPSRYSDSIANWLTDDNELFKVALNQWSLWNSYVGDTSADDWWSNFVATLRSDPVRILQGESDPMDFPRIARDVYGLDAIEIEASLYFAHVDNRDYFKQFKSRCEDNGVKCLMISNGWSGNLGSTTSNRKPQETAVNYFKWVDIAEFLNCNSLVVEVNGRTGDKQTVKEAAVAGLAALVEYSSKARVNILIENHNWFSGDPVWLTDIIKSVNHPFCNLNVDFGNFCQKGWRNDECLDQYNNPYEAVKLMMPFAKAVSAKTIKFDENGNEVLIDYGRMLQIVRDAGYTGYLGIEYSGDQYENEKGIRLTLDLIERTARHIR